MPVTPDAGRPTESPIGEAAEESAHQRSQSEPMDVPAPFSHPVEAQFARILDFYGIPWQYEPRTFVLARDAHGNVTEAFSPDFYLPEQDLYVELTTMQPHQIRHKNRKVRRLKELYPEINIKLFKRADIRALLLKFGVEDYPSLMENEL